MNTTSFTDSQTPVQAESQDAAHAMRSVDMQAQFERLNHACARALCLVRCLGSALAARELGEPG